MATETAMEVPRYLAQDFPYAASDIAGNHFFGGLAREAWESWLARPRPAAFQGEEAAAGQDLRGTGLGALWGWESWQDHRLQAALQDAAGGSSLQRFSVIESRVSIVAKEPQKRMPKPPGYWQKYADTKKNKKQAAEAGLTPRVSSGADKLALRTPRKRLHPAGFWAKYGAARHEKREMQFWAKYAAVAKQIRQQVVSAPSNQAGAAGMLAATKRVAEELAQLTPPKKLPGYSAKHAAAQLTKAVGAVAGQELEANKLRRMKHLSATGLPGTDSQNKVAKKRRPLQPAAEASKKVKILPGQLSH